MTTRVTLRRDPRVTVSFEGTEIRPPGLKEYLIVNGTATIGPWAD